MALTAIFVAATLLRSGVAAIDIGQYALYLAGAVALPGVFAWRCLLGGWHTDEGAAPTWFEDLSLGTIFGFGVQLPVYLVCLWLGAPKFFLLLPIVVLAVSVATPFGRRVWTLPTGRVHVGVAWSLAVIIGYGVNFLAHRVFLESPLALPPHLKPSVDETFHLALTSELMQRFPPQYPFLLDYDLHYHWFVHAQMASTSWATAIDFDTLQRQVLPATLFCLTVLGLGAVALRLSGRAVAAVLAPALLVTGGIYLMGPHYLAWKYSESFLSRRLVTSPTQAYGFAMALPAILLILEALKPHAKVSRLNWLTLVCTLFALSGAKTTFVPIFLCGALAVWLWRLVIARTFDRTAGALVLLLVIVAVFAQEVILGGDTGRMIFDPTGTVASALGSQGIDDTAWNRLAMAISLLVGWLLYGLGALGLSRQGRWRDPRAIWMICCIPPGIVVGLVYFRSGLAQLWFQRSTAEFVVLLSAWGLALLLPNPLTSRTALRLAAVAASAGLVAFAIGSYVESFKHTRKVAFATVPDLWITVIVPLLVVAGFLVLRRLRDAGHPTPAPSLAVLVALILGLASTHLYAFAYTTAASNSAADRIVGGLFEPGGAVAARWLERHSHADAIVATNVHCVYPPDEAPCDPRSFWISGYSGRRVVVEGPAYNDAAGDSAVADRIALNGAAFSRPSPGTLHRLVAAYGVEWLFVAKDYPVDLAKLSSLRGLVNQEFTNAHYVIFRVRDSVAARAGG